MRKIVPRKGGFAVPLSYDGDQTRQKIKTVSLFLFLALAVLLFNTAAFAQVTVSGKVSMKDGTPAPGVSVQVKGSTTGTSTDGNGNYRITVAGDGTLVFTQLGMVRQEIPVTNRTSINVTLEEDISELNEVVVVGYGTQKKINLSGSVATVDGKDLVDRPVPNLTAALQGVLPGVTITRGSGQPGDEGYGIRIRGFSSANNATALILVDGIE